MDNMSRKQTLDASIIKGIFYVKNFELIERFQ